MGWPRFWAILCIQYANLVGAWSMTYLPSEKILELAQRRYKVKSATPMMGRSIVVTGAAGGMGQEICKISHKLEATVVALDCNLDGLKHLEQKLPGLISIQVDQGNLHSVAQCATIIKKRLKTIDILVNNAGMTYFNGETALSAHGQDLAFTVNYLSHFFLTELLASKFDHDGRILHLTSTYHWKVDGSEITPGANGEPPLAYCGTNQSPHHVDRSYANTKLAQIWHAQEFSRRYGLNTLAVCPTWVATNIGGEETRKVLSDLAFDPAREGLTSTLNAMFRINSELGRDALEGKTLVANSRILDYLVPFKVLMVSKFVNDKDVWRDRVCDFVGLLLLLGQRFTHAELLLQRGSPEATGKLQEMSALYEWSQKETIRLTSGTHSTAS